MKVFILQVLKKKKEKEHETANDTLQTEKKKPAKKIGIPNYGMVSLNQKSKLHHSHVVFTCW